MSKIKKYTMRDYPKVSVIIPVYNREKSLPFCVQSILDSAYPCLEVILVNDGSTDNSLRLCREFARENENVVVIDIPNGGVSNARNKGIEAATGEWLSFVDSDDAIHPLFFNVLFEHPGYDLYLHDFGTGRIEHGKVVSNALQGGVPTIVCKQGPLSCMEYIYSEMNPYKRASYSVALKLFRTNIVRQNNIKFDPLVNIGEDQLFCLWYYKHMNSLCDDAQPYYLHNPIEDSGHPHLSFSAVCNRPPLELHNIYCLAKHYFEDLYALTHSPALKSYMWDFFLDRHVTRLYLWRGKENFTFVDSVVRPLLFENKEKIIYVRNRNVRILAYLLLYFKASAVYLPIALYRRFVAMKVFLSRKYIDIFTEPLKSQGDTR